MFKLIIRLIIEKKEYIKFLIAGGLATLVDFFFLYMFHGILEFKVFIAAGLAFVIAFFFSFYLQKFWTFRDNDTKNMGKQMFAYFLLGLCGLAINSIGMHILVDIFKVWYILAQAIIVGCLAIVNFLMYKFVIFKKEHKGLKKKVLLAENGVKKIKLLIATGIYPPDIGGPATYTKSLKNELTKFGYRVKIVTYSDNHKEKEKDVYKVDRKKLLPFRYFDYFYYVWKLAVWADVVYAHDLVSTGLPSALARALRPKKKLVIRLGGDFLWEKAYNKEWTEKPLRSYYELDKNRKEKRYLKIYRFVLSWCDNIIFSTTWQKDIYKKYFSLKDSKLEIIENAFPKINFNFKDFKKDKAKTILFIGRLIKIKNLDLVIKAIKNTEGVNLRIIGEGPDKDRLLKLSRELNLENRIEFKEGISQDEVLREIYKSYLFILPTVTEISPNLILECLKLKKPVLLTKESGYYRRYKDKLIFIDPFSRKDIEEKMKYLINDGNYNKYLEKINTIDVGRTKQDLAKDHHKLFYRIVCES